MRRVVLGALRGRLPQQGLILEQGLRPRELLALRGVVVVGLAAALALAERFLLASETASMLAWVVALLAAFNFVAYWPLRRAAEVGAREAQGQLAVDVAVITFFFYFAGGGTNPFVDLYLVPFAIAAASLPFGRAAAVGAVTLAGYLALTKWHVPLPEAGEGVQGFQCVGMWVKYFLCGGVIGYLLHRMASRLRAHESRQAEEARKRLQEDYLARAGALAAGAAHEIGTPLCTVAVTVNELMRQHEADALLPGLQLVQQQVEACRRMLCEVMTYGQEPLAGDAGAVPLDEFLRELIGKWRLMRPKVKLECRRSGTDPAPRIPRESGLGHAVLNLLNNAADASPAAVEMSCRWSPAELAIEILDRGPGIAPELAAALAEGCRSTKRHQGMGIGLLLARTAVERAGGELRLHNRPGGGTRALIALPLDASRPACPAHRFLVRYYNS